MPQEEARRGVPSLRPEYVPAAHLSACPTSIEVDRGAGKRRRDRVATGDSEPVHSDLGFDVVGVRGVDVAHDIMSSPVRTLILIAGLWARRGAMRAKPDSAPKS